jgi:hypothetical protein
MKKYLLLIVCFTYFVHGFSRMPSIDPNAPKRPQISTRAGDCANGKAQIDLDINNIRAKLLNTGDMWYDGTNAKYGAPKLTAEQEAKGQRQQNPIFAGSLWLSGKTGSGQLRIAAVTYHSLRGTDFYPGPISSPNPSIDKATCDKFDRFFEVKGADIKAYLANPDPNKMPNSIKFWPAKGNSKMDQMPASGFTAADFKENLAPFYDKNGNGIYEPELLEYPAIKNLDGTKPGNTEGAIADQMIFWVTNDVGNIHRGATPTVSAPIGVQINCLAFAFVTSDDLNNMTFYRYEIVNKGLSLSDCYISQFVDTDMGDYSDDYIGCVPERNLGFCVNADAFDATGNAPGYGENIPIIGVDFFEGAIGPSGIPNKMTAFNWTTLTRGRDNSDPERDVDFRNYQEGKNLRGNPFRYGDDCISGGGSPTNFCFPGNPAKTATDWSMCSASVPQQDMRFIQHSGTFRLNAGEAQYVSIGVVFVQPPVGSYNGCKINVCEHLYPADDLAQTLFDNDFKTIKGPDAPEIDIVESKNELLFNLKNYTSSNNFGESFSQKLPPIPNLRNLIDSTYKFEGYFIYQVNNPSEISKLEDLYDNSKSRLLKALDIKNDIKGDVYNFKRLINCDNEKDTTLVQYLKANLTNQGISHTFKVNEDLFEQEGRKNLVNNKTYYYAVVAFAYNNYQLPGTLPRDYRKNNITPLLFSSSIKIFSASPHNIDASGVKTNSEFFQGLDITRISGVGNGSYFLELADGVENKILETNSVDELKYKAGNTPFSAFVNNPYKVVGADFKLTIRDSSSTLGNKVNKAKGYWELSVGNDVIVSEKNIDRPFDQSVIIEDLINNKLKDYGVTIGFTTPDSIGVVARNKNAFYKNVDAIVEYSNSEDQWLQFLKSDNEKDYLHWIRTGVTVQTNRRFNSSFNYIGGNRVFNDPNGDFAKIYESKIAPYCLTANNAIESGNVDRNYSSYGPGFKWKYLTNNFDRDVVVGEGPQNNLDSLFSVDLVITKDKSKWSQCVVLETGETPEFHEFNAFKGQIRKAPSLDKDQNPISGDFGRSYFPGYAINLETGQRVNVYFGENSRNIGKGGANMWWDPTDKIVTDLGTPILGGSHFVYITNTLYDGGEKDQQVLLTRFNKDKNNANINLTQLNTLNSNIELDSTVAKIYRSFIWTFVPHMKKDSSIYTSSGEYKIPSDVRIKLRMQKPFAFYLDNSKLEYQFSTKGLEATRGNKDMIRSAFDDMVIVPNPYNAYSVYESSITQNTIKIVNVPKNAKISIFTTDGVLVRTLKQSLDENTDLFYGANQGSRDRNLDNSISWDLRTNSGVLVASGVYYINVESPEYGSKVLKLFATMRSADVSNF